MARLGIGRLRRAWWTRLSQAVLELRAGVRAGERLAVPGNAVTFIGRAPSNHVALPYAGVAPVHCLLTQARDGHGFLLIDAWSPTGTLVNGRGFGKGVVNIGDVIAVGSIELGLVAAEGEAVAPQASQDDAQGPPLLELVPRRGGGRSYALPRKPVTVVGRHPLADMRLSDGYVSEFHLLVAFDPEAGAEPLVVDLRSSNGTRVDGRPIHRAHVAPGQVVTIGQAEFRIRPSALTGSAVAEEPAESEAPSALNSLPRTTEVLFAARGQVAAPQGSAASLGYEALFGFSDSPFRLTADPDYLYRSRDHGEALRTLVAWLRKGLPLGAVTGPPGCGKSLLLACVARELSYRRPEPVVVRPAAGECTRDDLLTAAISRAVALHGELPAYGATLLELWHAVAAQLRRRNVLVAFLIDDADTAARGVLPALLRLLESEAAMVATRVLLVGREMLGDLVADPSLAPLLGARCALGPLGLEEVAGYMGHRLLCASGRRDRIFTRRAVELIASYSQGMPRLINVVADAALFGAFRAGQRCVDGDTVLQAIRDALGTDPA